MIEWMRSLDAIEFTALAGCVGIGGTLVLRAALFCMLVLYWAITEEREP